MSKKKVSFVLDQKPGFDDQNGASKILLLLIEGFYLGFFGLDRFYLGCYRSGLVKLMLFIFGLIGTILVGPLGAILLVIWYFWGMIDMIIVYVNALARWQSVPFCNKRKWKDPKEIQYGFYLAMFLVVLTIVSTVVGNIKYQDSLKDMFAIRCKTDSDCSADQFCNSIGLCKKGTRKAT